MIDGSAGIAGRHKRAVAVHLRAHECDHVALQPRINRPMPSSVCSTVVQPSASSASPAALNVQNPMDRGRSSPSRRPALCAQHRQRLTCAVPRVMNIPPPQFVGMSLPAFARKVKRALASGLAASHGAASHSNTQDGGRSALYLAVFSGTPGTVRHVWTCIASV